VREHDFSSDPPSLEKKAFAFLKDNVAQFFRVQHNRMASEMGPEGKRFALPKH